MIPRASDGTFSTALEDWVRVLRSASGRITWRVVAATLAIAAALEVWVIFEFTFDNTAPEVGDPVSALEAYLSGAIINIAMAFAIMFATFVADE